MPTPVPEIHEGVPPPRSLLRKSARNLPPPVDCVAVEHQRPTPNLELAQCPGSATAKADNGCADWAAFVQSEQRSSVDPAHLYAHTVQYH